MLAHSLLGFAGGSSCGPRLQQRVVAPAALQGTWGTLQRTICTGSRREVTPVAAIGRCVGVTASGAVSASLEAHAPTEQAPRAREVADGCGRYTAGEPEDARRGVAREHV